MKTATPHTSGEPVQGEESNCSHNSTPCPRSQAAERPNLTPDRDQSERFLNLLDEEADGFSFQTFDDNKNRKDHRLVRVLHGTLAEHWQELCRLNQAGAGVFVTVQETDLRGRKTENIVRGRAIFQEADRPGCPELPTPAHIEVESSPGKHHRYVLVDGCPLDGFTAMQERMVESFGSDPAAKDIARVLRVAGFYHMKNPDRPHMVRIVSESGELPLPYTKALPLFPPVQQKPRPAPSDADHQVNNLAEVQSALSAIDPDLDYHQWVAVGMALHDWSGGSTVGLEAWGRWSSNGAKYQKGECSGKWASFAGGGVTIKTVFDMAAKNGWRWQGGGDPGDPASDFSDHQDGEAGPDGWPDPLPIVQHETSTPYPLEALPPIIGSAVQEIVQFVQCPVALAASSVLSIVSTAGQALADVQRDEGLEGPISLFFETVGDSGERKTTVDNLSARALRQWDLEAAAANKPVMDQYEMDLAAWQAERDGLLLAIKDAKKRGEDTSELKEQLQALAATKPDRPKQPRLQLEDTTAEATAEVLVQQWPTGGLLSNEGGAVLGGHSMRKETVMANLALLNVLWDGGTRRQDRKTAGSYTVRGVRLTLGIAIQEATARAFLDGPGALARGIGFLARFLFAWPESTQGTRLYREPPSSWPNLNRFHERVRELLDRPLPMADDGTLDPLLLKLAPEAKSAWIDFYNEVEVELRPGREMAETRDVASKAADNVARMAALFHLFEGDTGHHIGVEHINRASAIVTWHLYEARRFLGEIAVPVEVRHAEQLEAWLVQQCNANGANRVDRSFILTSGPNPTRRKAPLDAALKELFEAGRVRSIKVDRKAIVEVNPALLAGRGDHGTA